MGKKKLSDPRVPTGNRLMALRKAKGFDKIRHFAADIGVSEDTYDKWEKGVALIPVPWALELVDKYKITLPWLYSGDASEMPRGLFEAIQRAEAA